VKAIANFSNDMDMDARKMPANIEHAWPHLHTHTTSTETHDVYIMSDQYCPTSSDNWRRLCVTAIHFASSSALDDPLEYFHPPMELDLSLPQQATRIASLCPLTAGLLDQRDNVVDGPTQTQLHAHVGHQQLTGSADVHCLRSSVACRSIIQ
jgi:hypothetical protein